MKIYQLRHTSDGDVDSLRNDGDGGAGLIETLLEPSELFTSLERAQAAAQELYEEEHRECLSQEEIDSEELSANVPDDLEWVPSGDTRWVAYEEVTGLYFWVTVREVAD